MGQYWINFFLVMLAVAIGDVCWTYYFIKVEERKAIAASIWSSAIMGLGAFSVSNYATEKTYIIAAILGAFIGTYASIWYKKYKEDKTKE